MTSWPECEFIIIEGPEGERRSHSTDRTGWETVIFVVEDEEAAARTPRPPGAAHREPR